MLSAAGLAPKDVAGLLGLNNNQVNVVLYESRQAAAWDAPEDRGARTSRRSRTEEDVV